MVTFELLLFANYSSLFRDIKYANNTVATADGEHLATIAEVGTEAGT